MPIVHAIGSNGAVHAIRRHRRGAEPSRLSTGAPGLHAALDSGLLWHDRLLLTPPIAAVETLRIGAPTLVQPGTWTRLGDGLAENILDNLGGAPFTIAFALPMHDLQLGYDGRTLEFHYDPPSHRTVPSYRTTHVNLQTLRVFVDIGLIEIYADEGRACCTKRVDSAAKIESLRFVSENPESNARLWRLAPR